MASTNSSISHSSVEILSSDSVMNSPSSYTSEFIKLLLKNDNKNYKIEPNSNRFFGNVLEPNRTRTDFSKIHSNRTEPNSNRLLEKKRTEPNRTRSRKSRFDSLSGLNLLQIANRSKHSGLVYNKLSEFS